MKKTYQAQNIMCGNCANTIKTALEDDFGDITINLDKEPREVTLEIQNDTKETQFKNEMADLGFDVIKEVQ